MSHLAPAAKNTPGKAARCLPPGAKEILQDFVVAVLRSKVDKDHFIKFAVEWFQRHLDEEEKKQPEKTPAAKLKATPPTAAQALKAVPSTTDLKPAASQQRPDESVQKSRMDLSAAKSKQFDAPVKQPSQQNVDVVKPPDPESDPPEADKPPKQKDVEVAPKPSKAVLPDSPPVPIVVEPQPSENKFEEAVDKAAEEQPVKPEASTLNVANRNISGSKSALEVAKPDKQLSSQDVTEAKSPEDTVEPKADEGLAPKPNPTAQASTLEIPGEVKDAPSPSKLDLPRDTASSLSTNNQPAEDAGNTSQLAERRQGVSAESYDPSKPSLDAEVKSFNKTDEQLQRVKEVVKEVLLFRSLDQDQLLKVIMALEEVQVEPHQEIIKIGDEKAEHFYVIEEGTFECYAKIKGELTKVCDYVDRGSFGELALMYNQPRLATVRAVTAGRIWALDRETFKRIVVRGAYEKRQLYMSLMERVDFLADLQDYEKQNVCDALQAKAYNNGDVVMTQGDVGDGMYFIEAGEVVCTRMEDDKVQEIGRAGRGEYVGELALIARQPRAATVTASADGTKLAFLDVKAFERLMGPCINLLKKNVDRYKDKIIAAFGENSPFLTAPADAAASA